MDHEDRQTFEEIEAHVDGVGAYAQAWLDGILNERAFHLSFALMTDDARRGHVEAYVLLTAEVPADEQRAIIDAMSAYAPSAFEHERFPAMAQHWQEQYENTLAHLRGHLATGSRPRPVSPGVEDVVFVDLRTIPDDAEHVPGFPGARATSTPAEPRVVLRMQTDGDMPRVAEVFILEPS